MAARKDFTQIALDVVRKATGDTPAIAPPGPKQIAGRKGGLLGGPARAIKMAPQKRKEIAVKAAAARWKKDGASTRSDEESDPVESVQK